MTREEAKEMAALLQAYAEGSTLQFLCNCKWIDVDPYSLYELIIPTPAMLRVKPEPASVWAIRLGDNGYDPKLFTDKKAATEYMLDEYYDFYGTEVVRLFEQPES